MATLTGEIGVVAGDRVPRPLELMQDAPGINQKSVSGIGQYDAASVAVQEAQPQLTFEAADLAAHCRLRGPDDCGRTAETSGLGDVNEGLDLPQVHGVRPL